MTEFVTWESALELRRKTDPGIDDPKRRAAARDAQDAYVTGYHFAQLQASVDQPPQVTV